MKKIIVAAVLLAFVLLAGIAAAVWFSEDEEAVPEVQGMRALFSWSSSNVEDRTLLETMKKADLNTIFQSFSADNDKNSIAFLEEAAAEKITVYALTGSPEWSLDKKGSSMVERVNRISALNEKAAESDRVQGVIMDVEPYLLDEFKGNEKEIMESFILGLEAAYEKAKEHNLRFGVCIPYYYDHWDLQDELDKIAKASDFMLVMNYYRDQEIEHMSFEAGLARKYEKEIMTIYELQAPGKYGLTERNTYYGLGLAKVEQNFSKLQAYFGEQSVSMAYHEYNALKEALADE
ncbi:hypothetical protein [Proteiniclasticum ruminis]|uniref:Glycosyl hydrolases family 18 n=1 Tax=Proteiniclasticum ruminis TaxID=398199 RepID=A0A1I5CHZ7_9CLOT|nr:hypothetical protein [Proteiniclasticum ruminis]SFN86546.1 hypothetical protein SAMN04488695_106131 [Proteiniclasticum ruminis]